MSASIGLQLRRDLRNADGSFCLVEIPGSSKGFKGFQTEVVEDSSNPVWNKSQNLVLSPEEVVIFTVMDRDVGDADDLLGKMSLPVAKLLPDSFEGELQLQETGKASAFLTIRSKVLRPLYSEADVANALKASQNQTKRPPPPKPPKLHEIELTVKAAKGLRNADWSLGSSGGSDPYVTVSVPGTKTEFQTSVVEDCSDPEWNFVQKLSVAPKQTLVFKVFDRDRRADELLGSAVLAVSGILPDGFSGSLQLEDQGKASAAELLVSVRVLPSGPGKDSVPSKGKEDANDAKALAYLVVMTVLSASGLRNADWRLKSSGGSDAYCLVEVPGSSKGFKGFQTEVVEDSSNPAWNKSQNLVLSPEEVVLFTVMDRDVGDADDLLGKMSLPVAKLLPDSFEGELQLQETGKASAFLTIRSKVLRPLYSEADVANALKASQNQTKRPPPPKPPKLHEIELTVKAAKGLRNADWSLGSSGGSDPYVTVSVPGTKTEFQTPVVEDCSDPEWNFVQKLSVAPKQTLVFKVFDRDRRADELLGSAVLAVSGILPDGFSGSLQLEDQGKASAAELLVSVRVLPSGPGKDSVPSKGKEDANDAKALAYSVVMTVLSASGLRNADWSLKSSGGSDAYCLVEVPGSSKGFKGFQTEVVEDSSNPVWNKSQNLVLSPEEVVIFTVMDRDVGDADDLLGKMSLPVAKLLPDSFEGELQLQETGKASAFLTIRSKVLRPLYSEADVANALKSSQNQTKRPPPPKPPKLHEIELTVKAAKGLRNADWSLGSSGGSDPYVTVSVPGTKTEFQTPVVEDCSDPEWNFVQKLSVAPKQTLVFKVFDRDRRADELLGSAVLTVSGILPDGFSGSLQLEDQGKASAAELLVSVRVLPSGPGKDSVPSKGKEDANDAKALAYSVVMTVLSASGLRNADWSLKSSGGSDAYCLVEVPGSSKGFKGFQTEVVEDSSNPVWNKSQNLVLSPEEVVIFTVMDRDVGDADDLLGKMSLPVAKLLPDSFEGELQLQETGKASAFLTIRSKVLRPLYSEADVANALKASQNQTKRPPPPKPPKLHEIELTVKAAKGLRNADWSLGSSGGSDPYVTVSVPGTKTEFQTSVVEDCSDPEWNFVQKLSVAPKQTLVFKVFDRDRRADELLGSAVLAVSGILPDGFSGSLQLEDQGKASAAELLVSVRVLPSASQSRGEGLARQAESGSVTEGRMERRVPQAVPTCPSGISNSGARVPATATAPAAPPVPGEAWTLS